MFYYKQTDEKLLLSLSDKASALFEIAQCTKDNLKAGEKKINIELENMEQIFKEDLIKLIESEKEVKKAKDQSFISSQQDSLMSGIGKSFISGHARPGAQVSL